MCWTGKSFVYIIAASALASAAIAAQPADEPPLVGQPEHFSGAVGNFRVSATARPTELIAEESVSFTVEIAGSAGTSAPPKRPNLRQLAKFQNQFQIQDCADKDRTRDEADGRVWEFHYQLRPRSETVREIPALRFIYYKPGVFPASKGYRTTFSHAIPLVVLPKSTMSGTASPLPAWVFKIAEGPDVLRRESAAAPLHWGMIAGLYLLPPLVCAAWYVVQRQRSPNSVSTVRRRQSQAARVALAQVTGRRSHDTDTDIRHAVVVVERYLAQRFDATLNDVLECRGPFGTSQTVLPTELATETKNFFELCDSRRFGGAKSAQSDQIFAEAHRLILALEAAA